MADPSERPILFNGEMVRAILSGRKTQTRRPIVGARNVDSLLVGPYHPTVVNRRGEEGPGPERFGAYSPDGDWGAPCPFGAPGDRLWVRETWHVRGACWSLPIQSSRAAAPTAFVYAADEPERWDGGWRPSIHMPRWASRLTLRVVGVRVERVDDISAADIKAEGLETRNDWMRAWGRIYSHPGVRWEDRPWVWVLDFEREGVTNG